MSEIEFTDRYQALGIPYPDPETMCDGYCEGTGWFPQHSDWNEEGRPAALWLEAHKARCNPLGWLREMKKYWSTDRKIFWYVFRTGWKCDGWHFIKCPECNGTGLK